MTVNLQEDGSGAGGYAKQVSDRLLQAEHDLFTAQAPQVDVIITTALIPGKPAPKLLPASAVRKMKHGSVIMDLVAEKGGNCELTQPGRIIVDPESGWTLFVFVFATWFALHSPKIVLRSGYLWRDRFALSCCCCCIHPLV